MTIGKTIGPRRSPCAHELEPTPGGRTPPPLDLLHFGQNTVVRIVVGFQDSEKRNETYLTYTQRTPAARTNVGARGPAAEENCRPGAGPAVSTGKKYKKVHFPWICNVKRTHS